MKSFTLQLDSGAETVTAHIEMSEKRPISRFEIWIVYVMVERKIHGWHGIIERDADGWKQSRESLEAGPVLPAFLVSEVGRQIQNH